MGQLHLVNSDIAAFDNDFVGLSDLFTDSVVSNGIQIQVDQGMAINQE